MDLYNKFYKELQEEYPHLTVGEIDSIIKYQFRFVREALERDERKPILLNGFGKFFISKKKEYCLPHFKFIREVRRLWDPYFKLDTKHLIGKKNDRNYKKKR